MKFKDLEPGDLFQFARQGHAAIYEARPDGHYRMAGRFVAGGPEMIPEALREEGPGDDVISLFDSAEDRLISKIDLFSQKD